MRTFKLSLDVETESPWQHRDLPVEVQVLGVFPDHGRPGEVRVAVHCQAQDAREDERYECLALTAVVEGGGHGLRLGRFDPCRGDRDPGNALEHVGSTQLNDGRVVHVYRRT